MAERIRLTENDFDHLARGGELQTDDGTCIILADIGFDRVSAIADSAPLKPSLLGQIRKLNEEPRRSGVRENTHAENMAEFNRAIDGSE